MLELRTANLEDAPLLARFAEKVFRDTFAKDNSPEDMDLYISSTFTEPKLRAEILEKARRTVLAFSENRPVGYYQLLPGSREKCVRGEKPIELVRLYVDFSVHGKGVAQALMVHALEFAKANGFASIWLGVWEQNLRAQKFYKKWNFAEVGEHEFVLGSDRQRDLIFALSIA